MPNLLAYDPAFAYELASSSRTASAALYVDGESLFYYLTVENESYPMPAMPDGAREGILRGLYRLRPAREPRTHRAQLLASGAILREALAAQALLERYDVAADVWSVTSWGAAPSRRARPATAGTCCTPWRRRACPT